MWKGSEFENALKGKGNNDESALNALRMVIDEIMTGTSVSQRKIIELRIEGFQVDEIARKAKRARRSVERVLQEFRKELSRQLHEEG